MDLPTIIEFLRKQSSESNGKVNPVILFMVSQRLFQKEGCSPLYKARYSRVRSLFTTSEDILESSLDLLSFCGMRFVDGCKEDV